MSIQPATYDLLIPQRASLRELIRVPYDGTEAQVFASVWDSEKRRRKYLDLDATWINRREVLSSTSVRATVQLSASWEDTREITKDGYWDLLWVWPDGLRDYILEGKALINLNATEEVA